MLPYLLNAFFNMICSFESFDDRLHLPLNYQNHKTLLTAWVKCLLDVLILMKYR